MDIMAKRQCFVTTKSHKDDFRVNRKYRLLNLTNTELSKLSKPILRQISTNIKTALNVNLWQNYSRGIKWFKNIKNKNLHTFIAFDIQEFYRSFVDRLLKDAVLLSQAHTGINRKDLEVIFCCLISLLFHDNEP